MHFRARGLWRGHVEIAAVRGLHGERNDAPAAHLLPSGAGHDGMAMIDLTDIAMIFLRCTGGISHNPNEDVTKEDVAAGARVLMRFIENFRPKEGGV